MSAHAQPQAGPSGVVSFYDETYGRFDEGLTRDIRRDTFGDDFGQNGWITAAEQDRFIGWLGLTPGQQLLDIACGSGGPTLRIAKRTGARVTGVDIHADAIGAANRQAALMDLSGRAEFRTEDASAGLSFPDASFDAFTCIDAINHLPDRPGVLAAWARVLRPGGRLLFTDPVVITGPVSGEEIGARSSIGTFLFTPPEINERLLSGAGFALLAKHDLTEAVAQIASRWHGARRSREADLRQTEGDATFEGQQRFLAMTARLAAERRLSRFAYLASAPPRR